MNYLTYIQVTREFIEELFREEFLQYVESIYLVRGFAKTDITIGRSDIDLILILKDKYKIKFKEIIDNFIGVFHRFQQLSPSNQLLSVPMVLFWDEFQNEHYHKFTEWGTTFLMEGELVYGKCQKERLKLADRPISNSLYQNITYHLARYMHRHSEVLYEVGFAKSILKRARRTYFFYTWLKHRKYIMNTDDLFRYLAKTDLGQEKFFQAQMDVGDHGGEIAEDYFSEGYDFYKKLFLEMQAKISKSEDSEDRFEFAVDKTKRQSKLKDAINQMIDLPDMTVYCYYEWHESWLGFGSGDDIPIVWCCFPDHYSGAEILDYREELYRLREGLDQHLGRYNLIISFASLFKALMEQVFPLTGLLFQESELNIWVTKEDFMAGVHKNFSFALYVYPFFYMLNRLSLQSQGTYSIRQPILHITKVMESILVLQDVWILLEPREIILEFARRYRAHYGLTREVVQSFEVLPQRMEVLRLDTFLGEMTLAGLYVPSRGPAHMRNVHKRQFQNQTMEWLSKMKENNSFEPAIVAGDLNVIEPGHLPEYPYFGGWEYDFYNSFAAAGLIDIYRYRSPKGEDHSWFGLAGTGYRFDHLFASKKLLEYVGDCVYLHEPRLEKLSDHSAMWLIMKKDH